ncbi:hypothetical protein Kpho02_61580 [Kitasatospora phosalacinea]|uniref:Lipoprotein n=1 Tax=Kitasatospora phosalacinea TaxID=2065 RepID=A0A9W6QB87_9ACTN|nr:hypothetical protein [Kitasatospora phosalacinea]GLW73860.1 hypothetical protein Kpho02_61580 [Kitasatospora phosalacinea]
MKRPVLAAAAALFAVGALLTGCGSVHGSGGTSGDTAAGASKPAQQDASKTASEAQQKYQQQAEQASAEHDRAFPAVARSCAGRSTAVPTAAAPTASSGPQPENPKYAENHGYLTTTALSPLAQCRGDAHAARLAAELARQTPADPEQAKALLTRLGYPGATVARAGQGVHFSFFVPQVGPCLSGTLSDPPHIEVHGPYAEGGCETPRGGH